jgi:hypothetical protein
LTPQPDFSTAPRHAPVRPRRDALLVAVALLVLVGCGVSAYRARHEAREATTRAGEARRQLLEQQARLRAVAPSGEVLVGAAQAPPRRVIGAIADVLPGDVRLVRLSIDYERGVSLEMQVDARSAAAWDRLLSGIERSSAFAEVEPGPEDRESAVRTTLRARWKEAGR